MKVTGTNICINCDELVAPTAKACPSCTGHLLYPLTVWVKPFSLPEQLLTEGVRREPCGMCCNRGHYPIGTTCPQCHGKGWLAVTTKLVAFEMEVKGND